MSSESGPANQMVNITVPVPPSAIPMGHITIIPQLDSNSDEIAVTVCVSDGLGFLEVLGAFEAAKNQYIADKGIRRH